MRRCVGCTLAMVMLAGVSAPSAEELPDLHILLDPGEKVPDSLDDAAIWQQWIERHNPALPAELEDVAATFELVAELHAFHGKRINWPALLVQSVHETGFYRHGSRDGTPAASFDVGGVGITLSEAASDRHDYERLECGILALYQHMAVYASGRTLDEDDLVSERTRRHQGLISRRVQRALEKAPRRITYDDLKGNLLDPLAERFGGAREAEYRARWAGSGGLTLGYSRDPFFAIKIADHWNEAVAWIEPRSRRRVTSGDRSGWGRSTKPSQMGDPDLVLRAGGLESRLYREGRRYWELDEETQAWVAYYVDRGRRLEKVSLKVNVCRPIAIFEFQDAEQTRGIHYAPGRRDDDPATFSASRPGPPPP